VAAPAGVRVVDLDERADGRNLVGGRDRDASEPYDLVAIEELKSHRTLRAVLGIRAVAEAVNLNLGCAPPEAGRPCVRGSNLFNIASRSDLKDGVWVAAAVRALAPAAWVTAHVQGGNDAVTLLD